MNQEFRRSKRRKVTDTTLVMDTMVAQPVGQISNLSESGMLLIASVPLVEDALYQFRFELPAQDGAHAHYEIGAHLLWLDQASAPGQSWAGFRFIGMDEGLRARLRAWIDSPGAQYA